MKTKRIFSLLMGMALVLTLFPTMAHAEGMPASFSVQDGNVEISSTGIYVISGSTTLYTIRVDENVGSENDPVNITLDNVNIDVSASGGCAFSIGTGSYVDLTLADGTTNTLKSSTNCAGLHVPDSTALTIGGTGSLIASSSGYSAGIGGNDGESGGTITINGGNITAGCNGYDSWSAGIGGGREGNGGIITINGGTVTAECNGSDGSWGAGIGGGCGASGNGGIIIINGGTVTAKCSGGSGMGSWGAGIGGGASGSGGTITITGGSIIASGSIGGAGSGGGSGGNGGNITIKGGNITASGSGGAGISGGFNGVGGTVYISGGTVTATGSSGAGIGGGAYGYAGGSGGTVYISGGTVYASSASGKAIGAGQDGSSDGTLQNRENGAPVYPTTVTLRDATDAAIGSTLIASLTTILNGSAYAYGTKDLQTDSDGKLYLYLPEETMTTEIQAAGSNYKGSVTTDNTSASSGALMFSSISCLTPGGTGVPISGSIVITFIGAMDASVTGTVSLNGGTALSGGVWSDGNMVFTVPYLGLSYSTDYTVAISGFRNAAGNTIAADSTHHFTTKDAPSSDSGGSNTVYCTIKAASGTGGSISPIGSVSVADGNDKTYKIVAVAGYEIKDVLVDGVSIGAVSLYTFKNIKKAHTITASFAPKITANPFTDVKNGDWFYDNVMYVYKNGLMNGTASETFYPTGGITRGMFVTVLYRLSGDTGSYTNGFADVPSGKWYENAVAWAAKNGIAGGIGNDRFAPDSGITRQQLAVLLYNYAKYKGYDVSVGEDTNILSYKDALSISDYAYPALQWACGTGIMDGGNEYLNPNGPATRAQVAAMLQRFVENVAK